MSKGALQPWYGVEQPSMSEYLGLAADILERIVVSQKFLTGLLEVGTHILYKKEKIS